MRRIATGRERFVGADGNEAQFVPGQRVPQARQVGGYPKIATVIGADLPRLGHALPGHELRFVAVSAEEALAARRDAARRLAEWIAAIGPGGAELDLDALYGANLIDGVIDAD